MYLVPLKNIKIPWAAAGLPVVPTVEKFASVIAVVKLIV
jgi:hypothetical protein